MLSHALDTCFIIYYKNVCVYTISTYNLFNK